MSEGTDTPEDEAIIIDMSTRLPLVSGSYGAECEHTHCTISETEGTLRCNACKVCVDPFAKLISMSKRWDSAVRFPVERLRREKKRLTEEVKELDRQYRCLKANVQRWHTQLKMTPREIQIACNEELRDGRQQA